jgi:hypothetical protein
VRAAPALLVVAVLAVAGCSAGGEDEPAADKPPQPEKRESAVGAKQATRPNRQAPKRDIAWLAALRKWELKFDRDSERVGSTARAVLRGRKRPAALHRVLRPLVNCPSTLRAKVGEPRAPRYASSYEMLQRACEITKRWALDVRAVEGKQSSAKLGRERRRAEDLFGLAHGALEATLLTQAQLPTAGGMVAKSRIEPRLSRLVSRLVYKDPAAAGVEVRCWSPKLWRTVRREWGAYMGTGDFEGFASGETQVNLSPRVCSALAPFVYQRARPTSGRVAWVTAASIGILAHEAQHLADPSGSEAETECRGMQNVRAVTRMLGATDSYASIIAEGYWRYVYPSNLASYRTGACRDGGPLDSRRGSDVWP